MKKKYRAVLPVTVQAGQILLVRAEDRYLQVRFSCSLKQGTPFFFDVTAVDSKQDASKMDAATILDATTEGPSILRDVGISIGLGLLIGVSIVFGFMVGVLHVTHPLGSPEAKAALLGLGTEEVRIETA